MLFQTPRLILRPFIESDLDIFVSYRNDPGVAKYQGWGMPYAREKGEKFISVMKDNFDFKPGDWTQYAVALKDSGRLIGDLGCYIQKNDARQAKIGYTISSNYWRKGYASEIIPGFLEYLFEELDLHRITADCDAENIASYRTLEKLGFRRESYYVESFLINGSYSSEYQYGMLQREWREKNKERSMGLWHNQT